MFKNLLHYYAMKTINDQKTGLNELYVFYAIKWCSETIPNINLHMSIWRARQKASDNGKTELNSSSVVNYIKIIVAKQPPFCGSDQLIRDQDRTKSPKRFPQSRIYSKWIGTTSSPSQKDGTFTVKMIEVGDHMITMM